MRLGTTFEVDDYEYSKIRDCVEIVELTPTVRLKPSIKAEPLVFVPFQSEGIIAPESETKATRVLNFESKIGVKKNGRE